MEDYIAAAAAHFEELLRQQLRRQEAMEQGAEARDFAAANVNVGDLRVEKNFPAA